MNIYFSGIGGVGIGPLAEIAFGAGYSVGGSDPKDSLMTRQLRERGVTISQDQSGDFLRESHAREPIDWVVYTSALPKDHPELHMAQQLGIKVSKRDKFLDFVIKDKKLQLIAIAGTHGKTTTTSLFIWTLQQLVVPISYSVGTTMSFGPSGKFDPDSQYFVYECDEYDRNFLQFHPYISVIPAISYDHPDTYPTEDEYRSAFRQFVHQSSSSIMWRTDADYIAASEPSAWCLQDDEVLSLELPGAHVRRNATLVLKALERLGIGQNDTNQDAINRFPGVDRRFEKLADNVYSDYAIHPIEIAATLAMAHELNDTVVVVYQPHQNVRQHEVVTGYTDETFRLARDIYWLPTYLTRENPDLEVLTPEQLTLAITDKEKLHFGDLNDELWSAISQARENGALVLLMGAGSIDDWVRRKIATEK